MESEPPKAVTNPVPAVVSTPEIVELSEGAGEVVKLAQSGMDEKVLLAFVERYPGSFELTASAIVYLADLGISETVLSAMIKQEGGDETLAEPAESEAVARAEETIATSETKEAESPLDSDAPAVVISAAPEFEKNGRIAPETVTDSVDRVESTPFYPALQPYGTWIDVAGYGLCWQPTAAIVNPYWQPYFDNGSWVYSSVGWYWHSNYTWGWAPFHYGRWHQHPHRGWVWLPGATWGPAWVTWRYSDSFVGWAPLPPGVRYHTGFGLQFRTGNIGIGFDFGLPYTHYAFVPHSHFYGPTPWRHRIPRSRVAGIYHQTDIINNYSESRDRSIINHGPSRIPHTSFRQPGVRSVTIRDIPTRNAGDVAPGRLRRSGSNLVVYRPRLSPHSSSIYSDDRRQELRGTVAAELPGSSSPYLPRNRFGNSSSAIRESSSRTQSIDRASGRANGSRATNTTPGSSEVSVSDSAVSRSYAPIQRRENTRANSVSPALPNYRSRLRNSAPGSTSSTSTTRFPGQRTIRNRVSISGSVSSPSPLPGSGSDSGSDPLSAPNTVQEMRRPAVRQYSPRQTSPPSSFRRVYSPPPRSSVQPSRPASSVPNAGRTSSPSIRTIPMRQGPAPIQIRRSQLTPSPRSSIPVSPSRSARPVAGPRGSRR